MSYSSAGGAGRNGPSSSSAESWDSSWDEVRWGAGRLVGVKFDGGRRLEEEEEVTAGRRLEEEEEPEVTAGERPAPVVADTVGARRLVVGAGVAVAVEGVTGRRSLGRLRRNISMLFE